MRGGEPGTALPRRKENGCEVAETEKEGAEEEDGQLLVALQQPMIRATEEIE